MRFEALGEAENVEKEWANFKTVTEAGTEQRQKRKKRTKMDD